MLHVRVGNVDFHGFTTHGFLLGGRRAFEGWEGRPGMRSERAERPAGAGSFSVPAYLSSRLVTLRGTALAESEAELEHMEDVLNGLALTDTQMTVRSEKGTRWSWCRAEDEVKWTRVGGALEAEFEISFFLADPRKFGEVRETVSTGSNVTAHHRGNGPATPRFKVAASWFGGYRIRGPLKADGVERSFSVVGPMTGSSVDLIDFNTGVVLRNGLPLRGAVLSPEMWTVPGGGSVRWRIEGISGGTGSAVMYLPDTFI